MTFHLRRFLAHLSPAVLERHLRKRCGEIADAVDWSAPADKLRPALLAVITRHPRGADDVIPCLERVHHLAGPLREKVGAVAGWRVLDRPAGRGEPVSGVVVALSDAARSRKLAHDPLPGHHPPLPHWVAPKRRGPPPKRIQVPQPVAA